MESSKEMLDELEQMPMTQFVRKYGHLTFNGIYELLEQQADLLRRAVEVVRVIPILRGKPGWALEYSQALHQAQDLLPDLEAALEKVK